MSALPIIAKQNSPSVGLFTRQQGTWAGFRPSWDRLVLSYRWVVVAAVIQGSTRGTLDSSLWHMQLLETVLLRSYRSNDQKGWESLSLDRFCSATTCISIISVSSHSNFVASTIGSFCLLVMELKSLADDWVRTGVCKLLSNLCCYELLSTSGFLRFDI